MNFRVVAENYLADGSLRLILEVKNSQLIYVGFFLEAFEGFCNYTTPQRKKPLLQVDIAPDYIESMQEILEFMQSWDLENF
ncbi:MAG: DUF4911 domain-containing protein [Candidatus Cloacimonadales bacterium]